ncbi:MAG TPA: hypothetical protein VMZ04_03605, partial [Anaerolineae bacterium]|nr:hypothetical protein [Anaerolineae bacterium]
YNGIKIRKVFMLGDPRAFSGFLVIDGVEHEYNEHPLHISVNGEHFLRLPTKYAHPLAEQYYILGKHNYFTDNWFIVEIPVGSLKKGTNEIILWTESEETSWEVVVAVDEEFKRGSTTRIHHPDRSSKSRDGGKTWDSKRLGWKDGYDGEYAIRLSLDRYCPEGVYISPVIDLAEEWGKTSIKKLVTLNESFVRWDIDVPEDSEVEITARIGQNPVPATNSWSPYEEINGFSKKWKNPRGRYLQFKVVMKAENPLVSPCLKGLSIETSIEAVPQNTHIMYRVIEFRNGKVIRSSLEFAHEDFMKLKEFRERFELDTLVADAHTEFEAQLRLLRFTYEIPIKSFDPYNWDFNNEPVLQKD